MNWEYIHLISHPFSIVLPLVGAAVGLAGWISGRESLERYGVLSILLGGIGVTKFYELVTRGDLELVHIGRRSFLTDTEIRRYVDELVARQVVA